MDYKSVFTNLCLELQQNRSWIKGLGKTPQKSELIHWRQCLLSGGTEACSLGLRVTPACVYTSSNVCHSHKWRVDTASGKRLKKWNACLHAVWQAVEKKIACIYALRSEGVNEVCIRLSSEVFNLITNWFVFSPQIVVCRISSSCIVCLMFLSAEGNNLNTVCPNDQKRFGEDEQFWDRSLMKFA